MAKTAVVPPEAPDPLQSVRERMENLRTLYAQYAEGVQKLEELNARIRSHMDNASPEEMEAFAKHRADYEALSDDKPKILRMALTAISKATTNKIRLLKFWVTGTIVFMSFLIGLLLAGMDE